MKDGQKASEREKNEGKTAFQGIPATKDKVTGGRPRQRERAKS